LQHLHVFAAGQLRRKHIHVGAWVAIEGVVAHVAEDDLERPLVRIGWDPRGEPVTPYEVKLDELPGGGAQLAA